MGIHSIYYWIWVAVSLYAAYLVCFCLYKVNYIGEKTDERIYLPRIMYPLAFALSFVPVANIICGLIVFALAFIAYYISEDFYFKSWLFDAPGKKVEKEEKDSK